MRVSGGLGNGLQCRQTGRAVAGMERERAKTHARQAKGGVPGCAGGRKVAQLEKMFARAITTGTVYCSSDSQGGGEGEKTFCVMNFYHLVDVADKEAELRAHEAFLEEASLDIKGRIFISEHGVNAQLSGPEGDAVKYAEWIKTRPNFSDLHYRVFPSPGHAFPKLIVRNKALVSLLREMEDLPVTQPDKRAEKVSPKKWREMLESCQTEEDPNNRPLVIDVRNDYEWDTGHFAGADRPEEYNFIDTPVDEAYGCLDKVRHMVAVVTTRGTTIAQPATSDSPLPLSLFLFLSFSISTFHPPQVNKDRPIMMYCTGGIRCDIYSTVMKKQGFENLYTLEGGIQNYLREEGDDHWKGSLYVFDSRMAVPPHLDSTRNDGHLPAVAPCAICGARADAPHLNCANVDCNKLFLACDKCKLEQQGCCCEVCTAAPRMLRPIKKDGYYAKLHTYVKAKEKAHEV